MLLVHLSIAWSKFIDIFEKISLKFKILEKFHTLFQGSDGVGGHFVIDDTSELHFLLKNWIK